jgi:tRNA pseudouridine55 synthase
MKRFVVLEKKIGETPLMALSAWKDGRPAYADTPASYAGRLDPMASGKLLVLLGDECKKQERYTGLDKEYVVEVLLDVGSDTGDVLGIVSPSNVDTRTSESLVQQVLKREEGTHERAYPVYSSKTVNGKPLFLYALEGTLSEITIPIHQERIYRAHLLGMEKISQEQLKKRIEDLLSRAPTSDEPSKVLGADFRIKDVRASWDQVFAQTPRSYVVLKVRVTCASGTYMRSLAGRMGEQLGTNALALSIHRTKIGKYWNRFWIRNF